MAVLENQLENAESWLGRDLAATDDWIIELSVNDRNEIHRALSEDRKVNVGDSAESSRLGSQLTEKLAEIQRHLEGGRGFVLVRGFPVESFSEAEIAKMFWAFGCSVGTPEKQDKEGNLLHHVRDTGLNILESDNVRGYQTNIELDYHNDGGDAFLLLCIKKGKSGGVSKLVSATAIFNEVIRRYPEIADVLQEPFYFDNRVQTNAEARWSKFPIFTYYAEKLYVLYKRGYIELAQRFEDVPKLTEKQISALDAMDKTANDPAFELSFTMQPGDIQIANNYSILHSRTSYIDFDEQERKRHMLRLWVTLPNGRPLPPEFEYSREFGSSYARRMKTY